MRKSAFCGLALGAMMTFSTAQAAPVALSPADMEQVTAGFTLDLTVLKDTINNITATITKTVTSVAILTGTLADGESGATAIGPATLAETLTIANANFVAGLSESYSQAIAAASEAITVPVP
jgi:hypothetical protein